jgi:hypothetical protein
MKWIGKGYDCYAAPLGVVFRNICSTNDSYSLFDGYSTQEIAREDYWKAVIGLAYKKILPQLGYDPGSVARDKSGNVVTCYYQEDIVRVFDQEGQLICKFAPVEPASAIYSVARDGENIWCAVPVDMAVYLYSPNGTLLQNLGSPFEEESELSYPEHVSVYGGELYISDMGHRRVAKWNPIQRKLQTYKLFEEPVWEWNHVNSLQCSVVRLESGIYLEEQTRRLA